MMTSEKKTSPLLVTAAIIEKQGHFLITQRLANKPHPLMWEFPGGKMEAGESPQQALQRELLEELEIEITADTIFDVIYHRYDWGPVLILAYRCKWISGEIKHLEVADHCWATATELNALPFLPADGPLIQRLELEA
jgi:8-oxo-dGTP diphosphatase